MGLNGNGQKPGRINKNANVTDDQEPKEISTKTNITDANNDVDMGLNKNPI